MNWIEYTTALYTMLQVADPSGVDNFNQVLPRLVDYAELRMLRDPDLDFLVTRTTDRTQQTTAGTRSVPIPPAFIVVEDVALITPSGQQPTAAGATRVQLLRSTRQFCDLTWPVETDTLAPAPFETVWAIFSEQAVAGANAPVVPTAGDPTTASAIIIAPTPDGNYVTEFKGTYRPERFYDVAGFNPATGVAANPVATTFLSEQMPDLLIAASMVWGAAYQHNFGAHSDDPAQAMSWNQVYEDLKGGAAVEEARKKSQGWQSSSYGPPVIRPPPMASPGGAPPAGP